MSHPKNRRDRFLIGKKLGEKRAEGYWGSCPDITQENMERAAYLRRDTTKLCSCVMCGNARRLLKELTMQEKKFNERASYED